MFENRFVSAFLHGTPGLDAWAMLGKAQFHARERDADGRDRYDLVIVDAPATGHGLDLLRVPRVILDVAPPGLLRREAERALELFRDPERAGVRLVPIPDDMPTTETIELYGAVRDELGLPVCGLIVNQTLRNLFPAGDLELLREIVAKLPGQTPLQAITLASRARAEREQIQRASLAKLKSALPLAQVLLPFTLVADFRKREVMTLAKALAAGFGSQL